MGGTRKLVMTFRDEDNKKFNLCLADIKSDVHEADIKALMSYIVSSQVITGKLALLRSIEAAVLIETTETEYGLK